MEKPINFTQEMIEKILDGTKTQTRRPCKKIPEDAYDVEYYYEEGEWYWKCGHISNNCALDWVEPVKFRHNVGDLLWCKEAWQRDPTGFDEMPPEDWWVYKATDELPSTCTRWRSPVTMPKEAARIWLEVENVWIERLWDISEEDAKAEGVSYELAGECNSWCPTFNDPDSGGYPDYTSGYRWIWNSIYNEKHKPEFMWEKNCFVEAYKFRRAEHEHTERI